MTTIPLDIKFSSNIDWDNNIPGKKAAQISFKFADPSYYSGGNGAGWLELETDDAANDKFLTIEDAVAYYFPAKSAALLAIVNGIYNTSDLVFTVGNLVNVDAEIVQYAQPVSSNLTSIAGIVGGISSDMLGLLGADSVAAVKSAMGFGISEIVGLQSALDAKAALSHTHSASDIVSGTLADARISQSNVTQHQGVLSLSASQITSGTKTSSFVSDFTEAAQDAIGGIMSGASGAVVTYNDAANTIVVSAPRTTSTQSLSLVGTGATGTQVSATKDSTIRFTVSTSTTSTIGGPATSVVALKICATNDATEGNWTTVGTIESDQTITLAVVLQSVQVVKGQVCADLPAGWYCKLVNTGTGTHSESFLSGQKTIYG